MEERFIAIEMKLANQENIIEQLSVVIYEQQQKIDMLERMTKELEANNTFDIGAHNVKPPHY